MECCSLQAPFVHEGLLHLVVSFDPLTVLRCGNLRTMACVIVVGAAAEERYGSEESLGGEGGGMTIDGDDALDYHMHECPYTIHTLLPHCVI